MLSSALTLLPSCSYYFPSPLIACGLQRLVRVPDAPLYTLSSHIQSTDHGLFLSSLYWPRHFCLATTCPLPRLQWRRGRGRRRSSSMTRNHMAWSLYTRPTSMAIRSPSTSSPVLKSTITECWSFGTSKSPRLSPLLQNPAKSSLTMSRLAGADMRVETLSLALTS